MEDIFGGLVLLMGGFVSIFAIIALAVVILMIIANIFLFRKMGLPGWYSIIPFWNVYNQVSKKTPSLAMWLGREFFRCSTKQFAWIAVREGESNLF